MSNSVLVNYLLGEANREVEKLQATLRAAIVVLEDGVIAQGKTPERPAGGSQADRVLQLARQITRVGGEHRG